MLSGIDSVRPYLHMFYQRYPRMTLILFIILCFCVVFTWLVNQPQFGRLPRGERAERIKQSPNYRNGSFQNLSSTPDLAEGANMLSILYDFLFTGIKRDPSHTIPHIKTNLHTLSRSAPQIVWFGHSSYLLNAEGKSLLVDPVLSGYASPFSFMTKSYAGSNIYSCDDLPHIDAVLITHDHYDHLDYETVCALKEKVSHFYVPLGVGEHLIYWGISENKITELDWWNTVAIGNSIQLTAAPARHFSGRRFKRGQSLWASYIIKTDTLSIYVGGDSGYDTHFADIGKKYGPFDLAILECGQYNTSWPYIHMMPEEVLQAAADLKTNALMPVHWGKFTLALHAWNEPLKRLTQQKTDQNFTLTTPLIGEVVAFHKPLPDSVWWNF